MMAAKNHALLLRASTIALALGGMTAVATPAWADGTPECNLGTFVEPLSGLLIVTPTGLECGVNSNANELGATAIGSDTQADGSGSTAVGFSAKATDSSATALGSSAEASKTETTAVGVFAIAEAVRGTALGANSKVAPGADRLFHIYDGGYCQPPEVRGGSHQ